MQRMRSWLFVPGQMERMVKKAIALPVDVIMLDLEDSVVLSQKATARTLVAQAIARPKTANTPTRFVRINSVGLPDCAHDLEAVVQPGLEGLVIPKTESVDQVRWLEAALDRLESTHGLQHGLVKLVLAIESPHALLSALALATSSKRITGLMFGAEDFSRALGLPIIRQGPAQELLYARSHIVISAAAGGVAALDGVWPDLKDEAGLERDCNYSRALGFKGKTLIHPSQIDVINRIFSPTFEEVEFAKKVIMEFEKAASAGQGSIAVEGQLVDAPIYERAKATVSLVGR